MGKKLYVGNLAYGVTDADLQRLFEAHGTVQSAQVIMDRDTGRSKGFGFVEMGSDAEAQAAIQALSGKEVDGRALTVNEAQSQDRGRSWGRRRRSRRLRRRRRSWRLRRRRWRRLRRRRWRPRPLLSIQTIKASLPVVRRAGTPCFSECARPTPTQSASEGEGS